MQSLSTNLRTHVIVLSDDREIQITTPQYEYLRKTYNDSKPSEMFTLLDADTKEVIYEGKYMSIKEFRAKKKSSSAGSNYFCEFGEKHHISEKCECQESFGISPGIFLMRMYELFPGAHYPQNLTKEQKEKICMQNTV